MRVCRVLPCVLLGCAVAARAQQSCEQWQRIGIVASGHVTAVLPSPSYDSDRTVFLGVKKGGLWKGERDASCGNIVSFNWTQLGGIPSNATVTAIATSPGFFAGSGMRMYAGTEEGLVYASVDDFASAAASYMLMDAGSNPVPITDLVTWTPSTDYVIVSTRGGGVYRSTNGLASAPTQWGSTEETDTRALARVGNDIYAAVYYLLGTQVRHKNGVVGTGWAGRGTFANTIPTDLQVATVGTLRHAHLATWNRGMWRTTDITPVGPSWIRSCDGALSDTAFHVNAIALCPVYPADREVLEARSDGPFYSFNFGGTTAIPCTPGTYRAAVTAVAYAPAHHTAGAAYCEIFMGTEEGLLLSSCASKRADDKDQATSHPAITAVAIAQGGFHGSWAASADGLLRNRSNEDYLLYNAFYGDVPDVTAIALHPEFDAAASCSPGKSTLFIAERFAGVFWSDDNGSSWKQVGSGSWSPTETLDIHVSPKYANDDTIFAATKAGLRKWNGTSWTTVFAFSTTRVVLPLTYADDWVFFASDDTGQRGLWYSSSGGGSPVRYRDVQLADITAIACSPRFRSADDIVFYARRTTGMWFTSEATAGSDARFCHINQGLSGGELEVRDLASSLEYISGNINLVAATKAGPRHRKFDPANSSVSCSSYPSAWNVASLPSSWDPDVTCVAWGDLASGHDVLLGSPKHGVIFSGTDGASFTDAGKGYGSVPLDAWATKPAPFDDRLLFITSEEGVFVSTTGGSEAWPWNQANGFCVEATRGIDVVAWRDCAVPATRHMVFAGSGTNQGLLRRSFTWNAATRSYDFGADTWAATSLSTGTVEQVDSEGQGASSEMMAASATSGFYTSTDCTGATWTQNNPSGVSTASSVRLGNDLNGAPPPPNGTSTPVAALPPGTWHYYRVDVPSDSLTLSVTLRTVTGNANLYLRFGALPLVTAYDYRSVNGGTATDAACARETSGTWDAGTWYIGVVAAAAGTTYQLTSTVDGPCTELGPRTLYSESFESGLAGWVLAGTGDWAVDKPQGLGGLGPGGPDPTTGATGSYVLGNDLIVDGDYPASSNGSATSPSVSCAGYTGVRLRQRRWLNVEGVGSDQATVRVSNNNFAVSTDIYTNPPAATTESAWSSQSYSVGATADGQANFKVRYVLVSNTSNQYSGWNVDDVIIDGFATMTAESVALGEWDYYAFDTDGTEVDIQATMTSISGNPDMYIRFGGLPTETSWMYHPGGAGSESVCINPTAAGRYYLGVKGVTAGTYSLALRRNQGCAPTAFAADVNVSHRPREARLVRIPTAPSAPVPAAEDPSGDAVRIVTTAIKWGTVDGSGVYMLQSGSWQQRNGTGWGALSNTAARSVIQSTPGDVFCGSDGNLFISEYPDLGTTTWMDIGAYVAGSPSWDITDFLQGDTGDLLVSMQGAFLSGGGVWLSANKGKAWMQLNQGFDASTQEIMDLVDDAGISGTPVYYASSDGSGVYDRTITPGPTPAVVSMIPNTGGAGGGTPVVLTGINFTNVCITGSASDCPFGNAPVVWFGGTPVVGSLTGNQVTVMSPPHSEGTVPVSVMNPDTRESATINYTFTADGSVSPLLGVTKTAAGLELSWTPSGRVHLERSDSLPFQADRSVDAVGSTWTDPDAVLLDGVTYFYRATSE